MATNFLFAGNRQAKLKRGGEEVYNPRTTEVEHHQYASYARYPRSDPIAG
jgi:hypothetical protein